MEQETKNNNYRHASGSKLHASGHIPVLLKETIAVLNPKPGEFFIDGTVGNGGHAAPILEKIMPSGKFLAVDWDESNLMKTKKEIEAKFSVPDSKSKIFWLDGNYLNLPEVLKDLGKADGLLLDLGFSSEQLATGRGFSFSGPEEPLLMTYDVYEVPVKTLIKKLSEPELAQIIKNFGEERYSKRISRAIKQSRFPIETNKQLAEAVARTVPKNYERGRIHPATRTFLALRIYANQELANLEKLLGSLNEILKTGGRIAIISFNSLEDRIVKNFFREKAKEGKMEILTKKPISPEFEEIKQNPRSRSAKLRAASMKRET